MANLFSITPAWRVRGAFALHIFSHAAFATGAKLAGQPFGLDWISDLIDRLGCWSYEKSESIVLDVIAELAPMDGEGRR
jgi:hypothetical protein